MNSCKPRIHSFENKMIDLLLRSKDYIGRGHISTDDPDKVIKNRNICKIIDRIRYGSDSKEIIMLLREKFKNRKLLIDGGNASSVYYYFKKIDLGNAFLTFETICGENTINNCGNNRFLTVDYKNGPEYNSEIIILKGGGADTISILGCTGYIDHTGYTGGNYHNYQDIALKGGNANTISVLGLTGYIEEHKDNSRVVALNGGNAKTLSVIYNGHTGENYSC